MPERGTLYLYTSTLYLYTTQAGSHRCSLIEDPLPSLRGAPEPWIADRLLVEDPLPARGPAPLTGCWMGHPQEGLLADATTLPTPLFLLILL